MRSQILEAEEEKRLAAEKEKHREAIYTDFKLTLKQKMRTYFQDRKKKWEEDKIDA
jgi:hypothetical protein